ncbi:DUF3013 family protein [Liquorilactobacillus capillatus]|uniref:DUF3013 family protein n=1 Tax=Liquorilactobacillus capillatus DSM 19910 TaxID=1423731 RepID=A0A0R1M026_9LACO|nr:DUF3013 family protein [Liquorilactobacillus capillatus]KRL01276.1 hypothetical protein FC81_GL001417 [Liquorilactobacillus capillatus DSM 19910]
MKNNLLDFIDANLEKLDFDGSLEVSWQKEEHTFTLDLTFYAENKAQEIILDMEEVESDEPIITFVDSILLYDQTKFDASQVKNDYLVCLPFDGKKGWSVAQGKAFFTYLQIVLDNGESDLLDFLNNEDADVFELEWSDEEYQKILQQTINGQTERLLYPKY